MVKISWKNPKVICLKTVVGGGIMALKYKFKSKYRKVFDEVSKFGKDGYTILTIMDFVKTDCVSDLIGELNKKFGSTVGNKAYPSWNVIY